MERFGEMMAQMPTFSLLILEANTVVGIDFDHLYITLLLEQYSLQIQSQP